MQERRRSEVPSRTGSTAIDRPRRRRWITRHDIVSGLITGTISGLIVAVGSVGAQWWIDDRREDEAHRRENLRFIREKTAPVPLDGMELVQLRGLDLAGQNLSGLDIHQASLPAADFTDADLSYTSINRADLEGANFTKADLTGANFDTTRLVNADFTRANLTDAFISGSGLTGAVFKEANLTNAVFGENVSMRADFTGANLTNAHLEDVIFLGSILYGADLTDAKINWSATGDNCYDETTRWPADIEPPTPVVNHTGCNQ